MEHAWIAHALIVITLLQQCRAEISQIIPIGTWFAANSINDGYSQKPIQDLFPTEPTPGFSPTMPIIVLPPSPPQPDPIVTHLSNTSPNFPTSTPNSPSSSSYTTTSTPFPSSTTTSTPFQTSSTPFSTSSTFSLPSQPSTTLTQSSSFYPTTSPLSSVSVTTPFPPPSNFPIFNFPGAAQPPISPQITSLTEFPQIIQSSSLPTLKTTAEIRSTSPVTQLVDTVTPFIQTSALSDGTSQPTITFRSTPPTFFTQTDSLTSINQRLPITSTNPTRSTVNSVNTRPNVICSTGAPLKVIPGTNSPLRAIPGTRPPLQVIHGSPQAPFLPNLKIRIVAPKGSITNVKINPSTTTKRPPTRRTKKQRNTLEACTSNCKGKSEPICAIPLGTLIVESNVLRGFPSICHMACHNSFKKDPYEKIVNGRCGRLRTRIVKVDTKTKFHREELKKSEYSIINTGPKAVVELAGTNVK